MLIADATGVAMADIEVVYGDTDQVSQGRYHRGFEVRPVGGLRYLGVSLALVEHAKKIAAELWASESDLSLNTSDGHSFLERRP